MLKRVTGHLETNILNIFSCPANMTWYGKNKKNP